MNKILVVDDEEVIRLVLSELLTRAGLAVEVARDGSEALDLLSAGNQYDIILSDIKMDHVNGFDLLREIKDKYPQIKIILITGTDVRYAYGAEAVIPKPFDTQLLLGTIKAVLEQEHTAISFKIDDNR